MSRHCAEVMMLIVLGCGVESPPPSADSGIAAPLDSTTTAILAEPLRALGTEPFWALDVDSAGMRFLTPDDTSGITFPPVAPTISADTVVWSGKLERAAIEVRVWLEKCSDGMSDREYPYAARVLIDGTTYRGCATRRRSIARGGERA